MIIKRGKNMIKAKIQWTSLNHGGPNKDYSKDTWGVVPESETKRRISLEVIKEFNNEKEMLDYCFNVYDGEVIIQPRDKDFDKDDFDYDIELYNDYRE